MPSKIPDGETRGWIVPIGGAENKENDRQILERFVRVSGGSDANIVVIPTASRMHETGARYEQVFKDLGAAEVAVMDFDTRRDCQEPGRLRRLEQASGIGIDVGSLHAEEPDSSMYARHLSKDRFASSSRVGQAVRSRANFR